MRVDFASTFPSAFPLEEANRGLAGISVRYGTPPTIPTMARARPTITVPSPMVRLVGLTNRQSLLDGFIGKDETLSSGHIGRDALEAAGHYVESWVGKNGRDKSASRKGQGALAVLRAHQETEEVLFLLRNALIAV